ncbi:MAG: cation:proton antiporter [Halobacteriales archaeon SW_9_67_25]|nr:MAG: cation:proton antiporter [Halobacteriales archaeon SW_9_67_25]
MTDAIVLAVVFPILAAVASLLAGLRWDRSGWYVAALAAVVELGLAVSILLSVLQGGRTAYELGGFVPPAGIELVADGLSAPVLVLVATVSLAVLAYARRAGPRGNAFYTVYLLLVAGLAGVILTGDIFNMYVFLEITGLAAYALVASGDDVRSAVAALKYLLLGTIGASLFLLGAGYAYVATGTLNMVDLAARFAEVGYTSRPVLASFGLIVTGLLVKVALFPVHSWQPDAYATAPDSVSAYISALVSTVSAYVVAGSVLAVTQSELKRMLAYSSVSQFGMIVAAFALLSPTAAVGGVVHLLGHAVIKGGLFAAAGVVARQTGARTVEEYAGLASRRPVSAGLVAVLALALVGVPPAVGFVGKWYIVLGAIESGAPVVAAVILASTLLTLAYVARVIERMYFADVPAVEAGGERAAVAADGGESTAADTGVGEESPVSPAMIAVVVLAAFAAVALGFAGTAIQSLLEPTLQGVFGT